MEWIIVDDGDDKIEDLVNHIPQVNYYSFDEKMSLGKKRNIMNEKCNGDFIVYMDDDDYYPVERVSHGIDMLLKNPRYYIAGCDNLYIYFNGDEHSLYQIGPYRKNHATAATFVFRKEFLRNHKYDEKKRIYTATN